MNKVNIHPDICIVCGQCIPACFMDVFSGFTAFVNGYVNSEGLMAELDKCIGEDMCGECENVCPTGAIYFGSKQPGGGGGGGGSGSGNTYINDSIKIDSKVPKAIKDKLIEVIEIMPCPRSKLASSDSLDVTFVMNESVGYLARYNATTNQVMISNSSVITGELISHELFHGYQDSKYPGMGNGTGPGLTNIEFEQYVFQSIAFSMDNYSSNIGNQISNVTKAQEFRQWIQGLTNSGVTFPNLSNIADFNSQYNYFLDAFNTYGPNDYRGKKTSSDPTALKDFFNGEGC